MLMPPNALTGHSRVRWVVTQAVLVAVGVFCYFRVRGLTAAAPRVAFYRFLRPPNFVNQYAAMPSLHAGWDLLVGLSVAAAATTVAVRLVGYLLPVLMAFSVVATANHYVVDVVAGLALALVGYGGALLLERRRERRAREGP
jgi:membrane-associated phospholipid phosphatase